MNAPPLGTPFGQGQSQAYLAFVFKLEQEALKYASSAAAIGPPLREHVQRQLKPGAVTPGFAHFEGLQEAKGLLMGFLYRLEALEKQGGPVSEELKGSYARVIAIGQDENFLAWLTPAGKRIIQRARDLCWGPIRDIYSFPRRVYSTRATLVSAWDVVLANPEPAALNRALMSAWGAQWDAYVHQNHLMTAIAPRLRETLAEVDRLKRQVTERIAAQETARLAAEQAVRDAATQALVDDDDWDTREVAVGPVEDNSWLWDDDDYGGGGGNMPYGPVNGVTGLPMQAGSCFDVGGNVFGTHSATE